MNPASSESPQRHVAIESTAQAGRPARAAREADLRRALDDQARALRHASLRLAAARAENRVMRENIRDLLQEVRRLRAHRAAAHALEALS